MYRRPATIDPLTIHLWITDDTTACGYTGESLPAHASTTCMVCIRRYGADLAAAFSHLPWLASPQGMTRHAFQPDLPVDSTGRTWPACGMRSYAPDGLRPTEYRQRCPHCLHELQRRKERGGEGLRVEGRPSQDRQSGVPETRQRDHRD